MATAGIASEEGVHAIRLSKVSAAAGVTKGALFHHFVNREALIAAMASYLMDHLDAEIDQLIEKDTQEYVVFTRAYIQATLNMESEFGKAFSTLLLAEPSVVSISSDWFVGRMKKHVKTDSDPSLEVVRYAADGAWLAAVTNYNPKMDLAKVRKRLIAMTEVKGD
ncbi:TetR/AcrR family transcriptional regulator [Bdellovibrio bacteriovorus]|uniref:HTH tetR-type domain-containing protein n=1 Tax=Bdellovibrio bacteriovorus TaxID=959 RepID=A0A1Z3N6H9_BDEBC|nr:TetR/AcrR family transcriptional regulator [Bdellovibrio bacteriovorus]ASD63021.1 hypothetical protein B9G79_05280 [Bdellovibrio bacteriovorus]